MIEYILIAICIVIFFTVGLGVGVKRGKDLSKLKRGGTVVINDSDPEKDVMRIELDIPISEMMYSDLVYFNVVRLDESQ